MKKIFAILFALFAILFGVLRFFSDYLLIQSLFPIDSRGSLETQSGFIVIMDKTQCPGLQYTMPGATGHILYFHGNGTDFRRQQNIIQNIAMVSNKSVVAIDYPGYTMCDLPKSFQGLDHVADNLIHYLSGNNIYYGDVTLVSHSIGTTFVGLLSKYPRKNAIMIAPYSSLSDLVISRIGIDIFALQGKQLLSIVDRMSYSQFPITIVHGTDDRVIPFQQGEKLSQSISGDRIQFISYTGGDHNHIFNELFMDEKLLLELRR